MRHLNCIILIVSSCLFFNLISAQNHPNYIPTIKITQGELRGIELSSRNGAPYHGFLGIPYVNKPERFEAPSLQDPDKWIGVWDGTKPGPRCIQYDAVMKKTDGSETDCLTLNVYTPKNRTTESRYSVLVYIHGGGFQWGTGHIHGAAYFLDHPVVLVTLNYRLGPFGFLTTGDSTVSGNMGMKDQVAALRWVQKNIKEFGGDPELVTIFGESAGGAAVSLLLLSPMSKGLFKHAISHSGASLNPWACVKASKGRLVANELGRNLNCPIENSRELVECLKSKEAHEILSHTHAKWYIDPTVPFGPVIENVDPGPPTSIENGPFLSKSPYDILLTGDFDPKPFILGVCEDEGIYLHSAPILKDENLVNDLNTKWNTVAPITFLYNEDDDDKTKNEETDMISQKIKQFYFKDKPIGQGSRKELTDLYSDRYFVHGVHVNALMQGEATTKNDDESAILYPYIFAYEGNFSFLQQRGFDKGFGVGHKDDLQYFFSGIAPEFVEGSLDYLMSENLIKLWIHFSKTGKPTKLWGNSKEWSGISRNGLKGQVHWLRIDMDMDTIEDPFVDRMMFWNKLMKDHEMVMMPRTDTNEKNINNVKQEL